MSNLKDNVVTKHESMTVEMEAAAEGYRGLCVLCKIRETCQLPRDRTKPSFYCDEFVPYESATPKHTIHKMPVREAEGPSAFKGLCMNCELRETCMFPKPTGGVWHCEEYV